MLIFIGPFARKLIPVVVSRIAVVAFRHHPDTADRQDCSTFCMDVPEEAECRCRGTTCIAQAATFHEYQGVRG